MTNVPPPGGGFPPPPSGPPGGGFPPPPGGGFPPPPSGPPGGGFPPPPGGGGFPPPGGGDYGAGGFQGATGAPVEFQDRLVSGLIDIVGPWVIGSMIAFVLSVAVSIGNSSAFGFGPNWVGLGFGLIPVAWILFNGYQAGETGQSFGMKQAGLKMVDETTGQLVGGSRGLQRNALIVAIYAVHFLCCSSFGWILLVVDCLLPLADDKKQTLRDKIGKTIVVRA